MARTSLMHALQQLAADHVAAERLGWPVEAVEERRRSADQLRRSRGPTRRTFLAGAAAGAAMLSLPDIARSRSEPRIAVVGGGIAGLTCALQLRQYGIGCTIYEASNRIGGRMHSNYASWENHQGTEVCGELIDSSHKKIRTLATLFALPLDDLLGVQPSATTGTYNFFGKYYLGSQAIEDFKPVYRKLMSDLKAAGYPTLYNQSTSASVALDNTTVYHWIESRVPGGYGSPMGVLLDTACNVEYGAETTDQSSLNLVYLLGDQSDASRFDILGTSDERYHIRGGNDRLPLTIAVHLGGDSTIRSSMRMERIALNPDRTYTLSFDRSGGQTADVAADIVCLALPFAVLRALDYDDAGFDPLKSTAIQSLAEAATASSSSSLPTGIGTWPAPGDAARALPARMATRAPGR
jgi:monoamine oxidase